MRTWALIPARGGSKSIPGKNLISVAGIPLLDYSVRAAQAFGKFDRIICSTDNDQIAARAQKLGVEVIWRPAVFASDDAKVDLAMKDLLASEDPESLPDVGVLVQPTSPFLLPNHISGLLDVLMEASSY